MDIENDKVFWEKELHKAAVAAMRKHGASGFGAALKEYRILAKRVCSLHILSETDAANILHFEAFRWFKAYDSTPPLKILKLRRTYI